MVTRLSRILVVGSINEDLYLDVDRLPRAGETLGVQHVSRGTGGKGANQASAAAHAGADVQFVGAVGDDAGGRQALEDLRSVGVNVDAVEVLGNRPTGTAWVFRDDAGENLIGVHAGANDAVHTPPDHMFVSAAAVLCQGEVRRDLLASVVAAAERYRCRFVLNLAPVIALDPTVIAAADPLVVNESEAADLIGSLSGERPSDATDTVELLTRYARSVVVTLGARGAVSAVAGQRPLLHRAPTAAAVIDTTGAGDAFVGTLVAALARGADLGQAIREGNLTAGRKVEVSGAFIGGRGAAPASGNSE